MRGWLFGARAPTIVQAQRWSTTLTASCAYLACAVSGELGPAMVLLFPVAAVAAAVFARDAYGRAGWAWTLALGLALVVLGSLVVAGRVDAVLAAAQFVELLCIHRLWHRRTQRDEVLLLLLSLLQLCAGATLAAEAAFGLVFLAFAVSATWAMALTHLRFEIESGRGPQGSIALLQSRRIATPALLGALAALSLAGVAGAGILFFAFPRLTIGGWRRASATTPIAGLSDRIDLSRRGIIADDPRIVLRARLDPSPGLENLDMHWRGRSLPSWTGNGWRSLEGEMLPAAHLPRREAADPGRKAELLRADIEALAALSDGVVLTPEGWPLSLQLQRPASARSGVQQLLRSASGDFFYAPPDATDLRYTVVVDRSALRAPELRGRGRRHPSSIEAELELPKEIDPRIPALAQRIAGGKDPPDAAMALERWLMASMGYTRELSGGVRDPVAHFLFETRLGHCELFSTAMVLMLRSLGIPARSVTGYYGGRRTKAGYYAVRAGDAHSWVEAYFPAAGWTAFDPTPAASRGGQHEGLWARLVLLWDGVQQRWRVLVVDYDLVSQAQAVRRIGQVVGRATQALSGKGRGAPRPKIALTVFAVAAVGVWLGARMRTRRSGGSRSRRRALGGDQRRAMLLWQRARAVLQRAGFAVTTSMTPRLVAERVRAPAAMELAEAHGRARWGGGSLSPAEARHLLRRLQVEVHGRK